MKQRLGLISLVVMFSVGSALAQRTDLSGITICIDPGHGGYNGNNDRHLIPDAGIDFWESESNFRKALHLRTLLQAQGATVYLTRETNDYPNPPDAEPSLSARWQYANSCNNGGPADWFHSIHSNATGLTSNTSINNTLVLLKEDKTTRVAVWPQAITMSSYVYQQIRAKLRTSSTGGNISGYPGVYLDYTFYGGTSGGFNLGVLNGLAMPGELSEGSMHDFFPETRRLMNNSYRKMEAYALRDAIMQYYAVPADTKGIIAGIQTNATTSSPVNNTVVRLLPNNTTFSGDVYNNGFYMFDGLTAGAYKVVFETPNYRTDTVNVNVTAGGTFFQDKAITYRPDSIGPQLVTWYPSDGQTEVLPNEVINLTFDKYVNMSDLNANKGTVTVFENGFAIYHYSSPLPLGGRTGAGLWPYFPSDPKQMRPGRQYRVDVQGVKDTYGNVQAIPRSFQFAVANVRLDTLIIDPFDADTSFWRTPLSNPQTTGVVADSVVFGVATSPRVPVVTPNLNVRRLKFGWSAAAVPHIIEVALDGGLPSTRMWTDGKKYLQTYIAGDASGVLFRFFVNDSVDGSTIQKEAGPWVKVDWSGWRLVTWDLTQQPPSTDMGGNGAWDGTRRLGGFQLSADTGSIVRFGQIYLDQVQIVTATSLTDVAESSELPRTTVLAQNYPNPFNPSTTLSVELSVLSLVDLRVYDLLGREVAVLMNQVREPGSYQVTWNAEHMQSGVYFYRLVTNGHVETKRMVLLK